MSDAERDAIPRHYVETTVQVVSVVAEHLAEEGVCEDCVRDLRVLLDDLRFALDPDVDED